MALTLQQLTQRIWIYTYEVARDRPTLGYIRGDNCSIAIDAGHSADHTQGFYAALTAAGLPLPSLTILTHWHWDHTFGIHAVQGPCLANQRTNQHLADFRSTIEEKGREYFLSLHESIRNEYGDSTPITIQLSQLLFTDTLSLDAGNCPLQLLQSPSPHTDDATLISVPDEGVLFVGDAAGGTFPTW